MDHKKIHYVTCKSRPMAATLSEKSVRTSPIRSSILTMKPFFCLMNKKGGVNNAAV